MPPLRPACRRCHQKKIRPARWPCADAGEACVPHIRVRRMLHRRTESAAQVRVLWLEEALSKILGRDVQKLETGSSLATLFPRSDHVQDNASCIDESHAESLEENKVSQAERIPRPSASSGSAEIAIDVSPDISLLTLNATGEMRYLGPSSGSFFAKYASNFAWAFMMADTSLHGRVQQHSNKMRGNFNPHKLATVASADQIGSLLTPPISKFLLDCFFKWVNTLFPLFGDSYREEVLNPLCNSDLRGVLGAGNYMQKVTLTIFNIVLALGAAHVPHVLYDERDIAWLEYRTANAGSLLSSDVLFMQALTVLDSTIEALQPSISMIQILLLICIYGGYKPSGNRQWQLAGIAIRTAVEIGLHRQRNNWNFSDQELDIRRRVFWTAYIVEITAAFNLGRPPSISNDHIDAEFPLETANTALALHHIRHRQIQSRLLDRVYCCPSQLASIDLAEKSKILLELQEDLDQWKAALHEMYPKTNSPYPIQYWERFYFSNTAALHRPTPLFPQPGLESASRCLRAAGQYIDAHHHALKSDQVPQSWMLLQGMFLAGITMIVTSRTNPHLFHKGSDCSLFEVMEWTRKCSVVVNIMSERWSDKVISELEAKFSMLATDTIKTLMAVGQQTEQYPQDGSASYHKDASFQSQPKSTNHRAPLFPSYQSTETMITQPQGGDYSGGPDGLPLEFAAVNEGYPPGDIADPYTLDAFFSNEDLFGFFDMDSAYNNLLYQTPG